MDIDQIRRWLAFLGETHLEVSADWVNTHCPLASWTHDSGTDRKPSFGVQVGPGESKIYCFTCGEGRGLQTDLLLRLASYLKGEVHSLDLRQAMDMITEVEEGGSLELHFEEEEEDEADLVFPEEWLRQFEPAYMNGMVHPYLETRSVPYSVAAALDLRYMVGEDRICFPVRNFDGQLVGLHGRAVAPSTRPPYRVIKCNGKKNMRAWLGEDWLDQHRRVVFAESVFDLARVYQVYRNVICPLSATMSRKKVMRVSICMDIVTMFDQGMAGAQARRKVSEVLEGHAVVHVVPAKKDPGDMTPKQVAEQLEGLVDLDEFLL